MKRAAKKTTRVQNAQNVCRHTFFSTLVDTTEVALVAVNREHCIIAWNDVAENLYGWKLFEVLNRRIDDVLPISGFHEHSDEIYAFVQTGHSWMGEVTACRKDGFQFSAFVSLSPLVIDGITHGVIAASRNISEQKLREERLRQIETRQRALLMAIPDRVFRLDAQMRYLDYYGPADRLTHPREELIGSTVREILPADLAVRVEAAIGEALGNRAPVRIDYELEVQGKVYDYEGIFAPTGDGEVVAISRDVTDRNQNQKALAALLEELEQRVAERTAELQRVNTTLIEHMEKRQAAEDALRESYARLQILVDRSPAAIVELDRSGSVVSWSGAAERMFGWTADEAEGKYNPAVPMEQMEESLALLSAFNHGGVIDSLPVDRRTKDGKVLHLSMSSSGVRGPEGDIERVIVVYNRLDENIAERVDELTSKIRALNSLSGVVSQSLNMERAMTILQSALARSFGIRAGVLLLVRDGEAEAKYAWGETPDLAEAMALSVEESIGYATDPSTGKLWFRAPILTIGDESGVLLLEARLGDNTNDLDVLGALAQEIASALNNARLFEAVHRGNERLETLSRRLVAIQEEERRHLGRELHDQIGQMLTGLKFSLAAIRNGGSDRDALRDAEDVVSDLLNRVRTLSIELRPPMLDDSGLASALTWHVAQYSQRTGILVDFRCGDIRRLDPDTESAAFRIVQEAMTNAARHADARNLRLRAWVAADRLLIEIEDNGTGFLSTTEGPCITAGLASMRERAHLADGTIKIESAPGRGTRISLDLPANLRGGDHADDRDC